MKNHQIENETHGSYSALLFDKRWKAKREKIMSRDGYKCVICGSKENLTVHHTQYHVNKDGLKFAPWDYDDKYIITLCNDCHTRGHAKYRVPIFTITKI